VFWYVSVVDFRGNKLKKKKKKNKAFAFGKANSSVPGLIDWL